MLRRSLAEQPGSPIILNALTVAVEPLGDVAAAEAACRDALAVSPDYGEAWHNLGNVLRKLGRTVEAAEAHANAARLLPGELAVHGALGMALLDVGKLDEAIASFRARAELDPSPAAESAVLFWRLHDGRVSEEEHFAAHLEWVDRHGQRDTGVPPVRAMRDGEGPRVLDPSRRQHGRDARVTVGRPLRVGTSRPTSASTPSRGSSSRCWRTMTPRW